MDSIFSQIDDLIMSDSRKKKVLTSVELNELEDISQKIQHVSTSSESWMKFVNQIIDLTIQCNSQTKALYKIEKILAMCFTLHKNTVLNSIEKKLIQSDQLLKWSSILDVVPTWRYLLKSCFPSLISKLDEQLDVVSSQSSGNQQFLLTWIKLCLQVLQFYQTEWQSIYNSSHSDSQEFLSMTKIIQFLINVISNDDYSADVQLLAGTALGQFFNIPSIKQGIHFYQKLYSALGKWSKISIDLRTLEVIGTDDVSNDVKFSQLAIINGILSSASSQLLLTYSNNCCIFNDSFLKIDEFSSTKYVYHAFQTLLLWYRMGLKYLNLIPRQNCCSSKTESGDEKLIFGIESFYVRRTSKLLWNHLDNSVPGVPELTGQVFSIMLEICMKNDLKSQGFNCDTLFDELLNDLLQLPYQVKGKHRLLACLVKYVSVKKILQIDPELPRNLLKCQSVNFMASVSAELYKEIIQRQKYTGNVTDWWEVWLESIIETLINGDSILRQNCSQYCVKYTLQTFPEAFHILIETIVTRLNLASDLNHRTSYLNAWVIVMKLARQLQIIAIDGKEPLREVLYHRNDDIRIDAFHLLTVTQKKTENLSSFERSFIKEFLAVNLNIDSPKFRTDLLFGVKSVLIRLRDRSISLLKSWEKKHRSDKELQINIDDNLDFLDWILNLCVSNLYPGASFQRKSTVLDVMTALYDTFIMKNSRGQILDSVTGFISYAHDNSLLMFHSQSCIKALLITTLDDSTSIQSAARRILQYYFSWPIHWSTVSDEEFASIILRKCMELCCSPRQQDGSSAGQLLHLLISMYVIELGWYFELLNDLPSVSWSKSHSPPLRMSFEFILDAIKVSTLRAEENLQLAASHSPGHGLIQCLHQSLKLVHTDLCIDKEWSLTVDRMYESVRTIICNVLAVLGGSTEDEVISPSFAKMGVSILSAANHIDGEDVDSTILSEDYKRILTWCWLNLKECSLLMGQLLESFGTDGVIVSIDTVRSIADLFFKILTKCRHRGAIEKCSEGFTQFSSHLLKSSCHQIQKIPNQILHKVLNMLSAVNKTSSITRRSAGLPLLITSVVTSELKTKQTVLLNTAVKTLLKVASNSLPSDEDQCLDLPQVHAVNILKAVIKVSSLTSVIQPYLSEVLILSIQGFSSVSWAYRNAATQLFGTVLSKVLGQKRTKDETSIFNSSITLNQFIAQYCDVKQFIVELLSSCHSTGKLQPTIFPTLAILSRLSTGSDTDHNELKEFYEPVYSFLQNPIYAVRELAAASIPVFLSKNEISRYIFDIISNKLPRSVEFCHQNELHGLLLLLRKLLDNEGLSLSWKDILAELRLKSWIGSSINCCSLTRALFMQILCNISRLSEISIHDEFIQSNMNDLSLDLTESRATHTQIGYGIYQQVISSAMFRNVSDEDLDALLLRNNQIEVKKSILIGFKESSQISNHFAIKTKLLQYFHTEELVYLQQLCIDVLISVHYELLNRNSTETTKYLDFDILPKLRSIFSSNNSNSFVAASLCVYAIILSDSPSCNNCEFLDSLILWSDILLRLSHPKENSQVRLYCSHALNITGCKVFVIENYQYMNIQQNLMEASMMLLQDENCDIRQVVCQFPPALPSSFNHSTMYKSVQFNQALLLVVNYIVQRFKDDSDWLRFICEKFYKRRCLSEILQNTINSEKSLTLFEQEEINMFAENVNQSRIIHEALMMIPEGYFINHQNSKTSEYIQTLAADICDELKVVLPEIRSQILTDKCLFNPIWTSKIHNVIESLSLLSQFIQHQISDSCELSRLCTILQELSLTGR